MSASVIGGLLLAAGLGGAIGWRLSRTFSPVKEATLSEGASPQIEDAGTEAGRAVPAIISLDPEGQFLDANDAAVALLGEAAREGSGKEFARLRMMVLRNAEALREEGAVILAGPLPTGAGEVTVHLEALAEAEGIRATLSKTDAETGSLMDEAPIGAARIDGAGRVQEHNAYLLTLAGQSASADRARDFLNGREFEELIDEPDRERLQEALKAVRAGEGDQSVEVRFSSGDEHFGTLLIQAMGEANPVGQLVIYAVDATSRRLLEAQIAQSQKMQAIGQLAGGVAHDFNNLLTAMAGFCDLLLQRHRPGDPSFSDIMQIKQNTNRAANLVRQLLAFSRQQTLIPRAIDLTELLSDLSHLLRRLIGEMIHLEVVHGRDLAPVKVDPGQLEQVLINLVVNSRDAMPQGGSITMRTGRTSIVKPLRQGEEMMPPGDYVLIEVIDTGGGIPEKTLLRVFEPFYTTKSVGEGTGLGLSTAFGIIKQFGGFMFVDSTENVGTTMSIYLPAFMGEIGEAELPADGGLTGDLTGSGTVLLVEDEDPVRLFSARALRSKGYTVVEARNGEEALDIFKTQGEKFDLVVTDVMMPEMDGPTLIREIREIQNDVPVVCISGYSEDTLRERIVNAERLAFLPKPFSLRQLANAVKVATTSR